MSAVNLVVGSIGTMVVESLAVEAGEALLAGFRNGDGAPSRGRIAACWRCPWRGNGRAANSRHATRGISAEIIVPGRARVAVPGLRGNPGFLPPKLIYDAAAGTGKSLAAVLQATGGRTQLVAPLIPFDRRTQSPP